MGVQRACRFSSELNSKNRIETGPYGDYFVRMKMGTASTAISQASDKARWATLVARRGASASAFFYGVKTTGVFCRSNCRSRLPKREHVVFFNSAQEALGAGFRGCKRCQPDGQDYQEELDGRIERACRILEQADVAVALKGLAEAGGMSEFHFHRLFKARLGVTPKQYQATHLLNRFKTELREDGSITDAVYNAGFRSASRAYDRVSEKLGMSPVQFKNGGQGVEICFAIESCPLGLVLVAATGRGVCAVEMGSNAKVLRKELAGQFPNAALRENKAALAGHLAALQEYLSAPEKGLSLPLDITGTAFQRRVWEALRKIPVGKTATYKEIARQIGAPKAVRAVGSACGANKVALAIPCHRAIRTDGSFGGYRWGVQRKRMLLQGERRKIVVNR